jgi:mevalonate pyrophosphate decarboxylase
MTSEEKVEKIKVLVEEINELSKELTEEELEQVHAAGGFYQFGGYYVDEELYRKATLAAAAAACNAGVAAARAAYAAADYTPDPMPDVSAMAQAARAAGASAGSAGDVSAQIDSGIQEWKNMRSGM